MAVYLDVLPRLGLTEAELAMAKLKEMAAKTGKEMGLSLGEGSSSGLAKLKEAAISTERVVSDANRKMIVSSQQYEAQVIKVAEVEKARGTSSAAYAAATARQTELQMKATQATRDHGDAEIAAAAASSRYASAKDEAAKSTIGAASVLNGVGAASFLGIGAAMALTTDKAMLFQSSQERLVTTAGESAQNLKQVSDGILAMAGTVGVSSGELSKGMYTVESAGFHAADGLAVLKASAQLAKSENADLATTTDAVTTALHDYHLPADQAAEVSSKLVTAVSQGKTTVENFAGSLHSVQPLAASLGININDLYGSLSAMTASGESADQSTQNMADALRHLAKPTIEMSKNLSDIGLDARDLSANLGTTGLAGTMQEISESVLQHMGPSGLVLLDSLNQSKQAADNANTMFKSLPPTLQDIATKAQTTGDFTGFRKAIGGLNLETRNLATQWLSAANNANGFNNKLKSGGADVQTYTSALQGAVGDASSLNVALQLTGDNAAKTSQNIRDLGDAHQDANGNVKGFNETEQTLKQKLDEAKAGFGSAAIELGNVFIPEMTKTIDVLKDTAEFLVAHKDAVQDAVVVVGLFGATWATVKVGLAAQGVWNALAGGIDLAVLKFKALRDASATTAAAVEVDAAAESKAVTGVGAAALKAAGLIAAMGFAAKGAMDYANEHKDDPSALDKIRGDDTRNNDWVSKVTLGIPIIGSWLNMHLPGEGEDPNKDRLPTAAGDQFAKPGAQAERQGGRAHDYAPPVPGGGALNPSAIQNAAPGDPSTDPWMGGGSPDPKATKAPKGDKNDPIWIAPQNSSDFKNDEDHGVTGSSILAGGFDLSPKSIGTFFTALITDLALGNPIGKTLADKQKRGDSASNPMYVSSVDVDRAQKSLDEAIHGYGPDSTEAKSAAAKLQATKAAVGATGGYFNPQTGTFSSYAKSGPGYTSDADLLAGVPSGKYSQDASRDLFKGLSDCSSSVGDLVNRIDGQKSGTGGNLTTGNAASWLPQHGFVPGDGGPGDFRVGYNAEHMQATLPGGTNWNYGSPAAAAARGISGGGAHDPTGGGTGAFTSHYYRPTSGGGDAALTSDANTNPALYDPMSADGGLTSLRDQFLGGGGLGPTFAKPRPIPGSGLASAGVNSAQFGGIGMPGASGGAAPGSIGPFPVPARVAAAAPNAAPGSHMTQDASKPSNSVSNAPRTWGSGKGATSSIASSVVSAAGPLAAMAPGSAQAAQLADRTIGYAAQLGGIAVEGIMSSLIPTGGGGGIGDPSHSVLGKIAGGVAGAHKSAPNSAGATAPPGPKAEDKPQQPGGDQTHIGSQNNGTQVMGDMHVHTNDAKSFASDQPQNIYPSATR